MDFNFLLAITEPPSSFPQTYDHHHVNSTSLHRFMPLITYTNLNPPSHTTPATTAILRESPLIINLNHRRATTMTVLDLLSVST